MPASVLEELRTFRIPAPLTTSALTASKPEPYILLFARAGFDPALVEAANTDDSISLITADDLVATLTADASTGRDEPERHTVRRV